MVYSDFDFFHAFGIPNILISLMIKNIYWFICLSFKNAEKFELKVNMKINMKNARKYLN